MSGGTHHIEDLSSRAVQLTNDSAGLDIDDLDGEVVAGGGEEVVLALEENGGDGSGEGEGSDELHHLEVEELRWRAGSASGKAGSK